MRCLIGSQCNFLSSIGACDMFKFWCICNDTSQNLLNALYFVQVCLRNAIVEWIAIIKLFAGDEWIDIFARKIALANVRGVRESHSPCAGEWTKWLHWLLNALSAATNWWRPALCAFVLTNRRDQRPYKICYDLCPAPHKLLQGVAVDHLMLGAWIIHWE